MEKAIGPSNLFPCQQRITPETCSSMPCPVLGDPSNRLPSFFKGDYHLDKTFKTYVQAALCKSSELHSSKLGLNTAVCMHQYVLILKTKLRAVTAILIRVVNNSLVKAAFTLTPVHHARKLFGHLLSICRKVHTGASSASFSFVKNFGILKNLIINQLSNLAKNHCPFHLA